MARITSNVHTGQRGQAGKSKSRSRSKKKAKRLARIKCRVGFSRTVVFLFWLHDLIPGYTLLNKTIGSSKKVFYFHVF